MIRILALGLLVLAILAVKYLPWWALLGLLAAAVLVVTLLGKRLWRTLFLLPFRAKGRVLRGATAEVRSVARGEAPATVAGSVSSLSWYTIEVTITPDASAGAGSFTLWEPGELVLVKPETKPGPPPSGEGSWRAEHLEIWQDGAYTEDEGYKLPGPQRLRMTVGLPHALSRARFRYYFEVFGEVALP